MYNFLATCTYNHILGLETFQVRFPILVGISTLLINAFYYNCWLLKEPFFSTTMQGFSSFVLLFFFVYLLFLNNVLDLTALVLS